MRNQSQVFALGRLKTGEMNKLEAEYDRHLKSQLEAGEIAWYKFNALKLRLADNTFYTVDFAVMNRDGLLCGHECKGFMMEDANVKIKVAAALFPLKFFVVRKKLKRDGGGFSVEEV